MSEIETLFHITKHIKHCSNTRNQFGYWQFTFSSYLSLLEAIEVIVLNLKQNYHWMISVALNHITVMLGNFYFFHNGYRASYSWFVFMSKYNTSWHTLKSIALCIMDRIVQFMDNRRAFRECSVPALLFTCIITHANFLNIKTFDPRHSCKQARVDNQIQFYLNWIGFSIRLQRQCSYR